MAGQGFTVGVMARAPVAGEAKTRLIPLLGADGAAQLQRELTRRALALACAAAPGAATLFTTGDEGHPFWVECRAAFDIAVAPQRGADLGERMLHALSALLHRYPRALLIGTDCPALRAEDLQQAATMLGAARMVFTPAEDGGYVLVGAREVHAPAFKGIAWGESGVMRDTRAALAAAGWRAGLDWEELPTSWDLDRPEDFERASAAGLLSQRSNSS